MRTRDASPLPAWGDSWSVRARPSFGICFLFLVDQGILCYSCVLSEAPDVSSFTHTTERCGCASPSIWRQRSQTECRCCSQEAYFCPPPPKRREPVSSFVVSEASPIFGKGSGQVMWPVCSWCCFRSGYEQALASHFGELVARKSQGGVSSTDSLPAMAELAEDPRASDRVTAMKGVADVAVVYDLGQKMRLLQETAAGEQQAALLRARRREGMKVSESKEKKVAEKIKRDAERLRKSLPPPSERAPVVAMVTFTSIRIRDVVMNRYVPCSR